MQRRRRPHGKGYVETGSGRVEFAEGFLDPYVAEVVDFADAARGQASVGADAHADLALTQVLERMRTMTARS